MLRVDDPLQLFVGNMTGCCQEFGNVGEGAMLHGSLERNGGIFVIEKIDEKGESACNADGGDRYVSQRYDHRGIDQGSTGGQKILQGNGNGKRERHTQELPKRCTVFCGLNGGEIHFIVGSFHGKYAYRNIVSQSLHFDKYFWIKTLLCSI
jgi:hypothetical protein